MRFLLATLCVITLWIGGAPVVTASPRILHPSLPLITAAEITDHPEVQAVSTMHPQWSPPLLQNGLITAPGPAVLRQTAYRVTYVPTGNQVSISLLIGRAQRGRTAVQLTGSYVWQEASPQTPVTVYSVGFLHGDLVAWCKEFAAGQWGCYGELLWTYTWKTTALVGDITLNSANLAPHAAAQLTFSVALSSTLAGILRGTTRFDHDPRFAPWGI